MTVKSRSYAQFAHMTYAAPRGAAFRQQTEQARRSGKLARAWNIKELLDEANREPDAIPHVTAPQPPIWHLGSAAEVELAAMEWHAQATEKNGRIAKCTSPGLCAAVISLNRGRDSDWPEYRNAALEHVKQEFGADRVKGIVEHQDEGHSHVHIFMVPRHGVEFGSVHPGYQASRASRKTKGNKVKTSFRRAMVEWQDRLYEGVSRLFGLTRFGPKRERRSREAQKLFAAAQLDADQIVAAAKERGAKAKTEADERDAASRAKADAAERSRMESLKLHDYVAARQAKYAGSAAGYADREYAALQAKLDAALLETRNLKAALQGHEEAAAAKNGILKGETINSRLGRPAKQHRPTP